MDKQVQISKELFKTILQDSETTKSGDLQLLQTIYSFDNHEASATDLAKTLGYKDKIVANAIIGRFGKRIAEKYGVQREQLENGSYVTYTLFFNGHWEDAFYIWELKPELIQALEELSLNTISHEKEIQNSETQKTFTEGTATEVTLTRYERDPKARTECIKYYGYTCSVCSFDFEKHYGQIGKNFIHVHHLTEISSIGETYEINPIKDLRPVCPNCHAMIHRRKPLLSIEELKKEIQ